MPYRKAANHQGVKTPEVERDPKPEAGTQAPKPSGHTREFEIEIKQMVVVSKIDSLIEAWCERCHAQGQWVAPDAAAVILSSDTRSIYRRIESNAVHFTETTEGLALVCLSSLFE